jgi:hypothetical protein
LERQRQSEGWRRAITADTPRTTLERSIGLLNGNDEDWGAGLEICPVPHLINDDGRIGWDEDFLFAVFVFQRQDEPGSRIGGQAAHQSRGAADCGEYREATGVSEDLAVARAKRAVPWFPRNFVLPQEFAPGDGVGMGVAAVCSREKH